MQNDDIYILPPEAEGAIDNFYDMAFKEKDYQSPIYSDLKSIDQHFVNKQFLSSGGMKYIYTVDDQRTARPIVMAELKKDGFLSQEDIEQFLREARISASLEHPNIVPIYDIGLNREGKPFFTMKFLKGESLKQIIRELLKANPTYIRKYTLNILLDIFLKVCEAVSFAHSCGVVHLDIKPANIMIGNHGEVYLCDWGLAKLLDSSDVEHAGITPLDENIFNDMTLSGMVKGTPGFMAPEQIDDRFGQKNKQTDIYAIGALLYSILSLRKPFDGLKVDDVLNATLEYEITPPKDVTSREVSESLNSICMKAMEKEQSSRYDSVDSLITDIRSYQEGFATKAEEVTPFKALALLLKRNRLLSTMILLVVITGVVVGGVLGNMLEQSETIASEKLQHKDVEMDTLQQKARTVSEKLQKIKKLVASGVVAKWKLDEGSGIWVGDEMGLKRGIRHGGIKWVNGYVGKALQFGGVGDYVSFGDVKWQALSMALWVKLDKQVAKEGKPMTLLQYGPDSNEDFVSFGEVSAYAEAETLTILRKKEDSYSRTYIRDNILPGWHHIALVWGHNEGHYKIFIDGEEKKVYQGVDSTGDILQHAPLMKFSNFKLGTDRIADNRGNFIGLIDEVSIYGRALSDKEVAKMAEKVD